jgi:mannose-6-phosphate isomerase-like protein (cupin superfamily)
MPDYLVSHASDSTNDNIFTYNSSGDGWGLVRLEPGIVGPWLATHGQHFICYVSAGEVAVSFGDGYAIELEEVVVKEGWVWEVRRCNSFQPRNTSSTRPAMFEYLKVSSPDNATQASPHTSTFSRKSTSSGC